MRTIKTEMGSIFLLLIALAVTVILTGCGKDDSVIDSTPATTEETLLNLAESDDQIASFDDNYNEEDAMDMVAKVSETIYPKKVGQRMHPVSKTFTVNVVGDSAFAVYTKTYEGTLIIVAATVNGGLADTIIYKPFTTTITRNLKFVKKDSSCVDSTTSDWKIVAVSLPEGGTANSTVVLMELNVFLPNGDTITVTSPNDYYLARQQTYRGQVPNLYQNQRVTVRVELLSSHSDAEFVTLTCNGNRNGLNKTKRMFTLVSSEQYATGYKKVYEGYWMTNTFPGAYHAVVNALASSSITDNEAPVESSSWGIPYIIK